jgi:outer membrane receptor protein involved in Fe transport
MNLFMEGNLLALAMLSLAAAPAEPASQAPIATAPPSPFSPAAAAPLGEVTVTAERRAQAASRTPISLVAYGPRAVERRGLHNIDDIARLTPGVDFTRTGFGNVSRIAVRGLISKIGAATAALYVDDAPMMVRTLGFTSINIYPSTFDLDRIEVLRGPQGTLFGAGAIGGAVRFITPEPGLDHWSGKARGELATVAHGEANYEAGAVIDGPLVKDKAGVRLTLWTRRDGGFIDHVDRNTGELRQKDSNRLDTYLARLAFTFKPTERLSISPRVYFQDRRLRDNNFFWEAFSDAKAGRFANAAQVSQPDRDRGVLSMVKLGYDLGWARLDSDTSLFWRGEKQRIDYSTFIPSSALGAPVVRRFPNYVAWSDMENKQNIFTQEVRLQSKGDEGLRWLVGGFYADNRQRARQLTIDPQADALVRAATGYSFQQATGQALISGLYSYRGDETAYDHQLAAFGELRYEVLPKLTATAGVRVSSVRFRFVSDRAGGYASGAPHADCVI